MTLIRNNQKLDNALYINRVAFKIAFIITMLLSAVPYIHGILSPYIKILLVWGIGSVGCDILTGARLIRNKFTGILLAFAGCYGISIILNRDLNFTTNIKTLAYMVVIFILLYGHDLSVDKEKVKNEMRLLSYIFCVIAFILSFICFMTYALSIRTHYNTADGWMYIGMFENRLWGLYNPNTGSAINTVTIILTVFLMFTRRKKSKLILAFHIVNLCIQLFCLKLTSSRTALYVLYIAAAMLIFYLIPMKWLKERSFKNYAIRIVAAALSVLCLSAAMEAVKIGLSYVPSLVSSVISVGNGDNDGFEIAPEDLERIEIMENREGGFLTGRQYLWNAGLNAFKKAPVFGVTRENIYDYAQEFIEGNSWKGSLKAGGLHNIYITILTSSGIVGFAVMALFAVWSLIKMLKALYQKKFSGKNRYWFICGFVLIIIFFIMEMFEARILYHVNIFYLVFWSYYGYTMYFTEKVSVPDAEHEQNACKITQ